MSRETDMATFRELIAAWTAADLAARELVVTVERRKSQGPPDVGTDAAGWQRCIDALTSSREWLTFTERLATFERLCQSTGAAMASPAIVARKPAAEPPTE